MRGSHSPLFVGALNEQSCIEETTFVSAMPFNSYILYLSRLYIKYAVNIIKKNFTSLYPSESKTSHLISNRRLRRSTR